jgi:NADH-quinone oxidoreductase subunit M
VPVGGPGPGAGGGGVVGRLSATLPQAPDERPVHPLPEARDERLVHPLPEAPDERPLHPLPEAPDERPVHALPAAAGPPGMADIRRHELVAWVPLIGLILLFGLWPGLLLSLTTPAVQILLGALP